MAIKCDACGDELWTAMDTDGLNDYTTTDIEVTDRKNIPRKERYHLCDSCLEDLRNSFMNGE